MNLNSEEVFKLKYLKYKQKYLELKGGKKCPTLGFHQHISECWHDAYSTIMLYTDNISDNAQYILENYTKSFETVEELVEDILDFAQNNNELQILLPLNIDDSVYEKYKNYCRNYLLNLFNRYLNERLKLAKDIIPTKKKVQQNVLVRQGSVKESLLCTTNVFNILNINNLEPEERNVITNGGLHEKDLYFITCAFNYYLMNYILPHDLKLKTPEEIKEIKKDIPQNYIYNQFVEFDKIFDTKTPSKELISRLLQIKESINKCDAINIGIAPYISKLSDAGNFILNVDKRTGHMICTFICDKKEYIYDNEGIDKYKLDKYKQIGGVGTEILEGQTGQSVQSVQSVQSIHEADVREIFEKRFGEGKFDTHDAVKPYETHKSFTEFRWKKYFSDNIDKIIIIIKQNQELKKHPKEYYGTVRQLISDFLRGNDIWNKFHIENIQLYTLNKFEKGKTIVQKETNYYASIIKILDNWDLLSAYKLDPVRLERFILNNNTKMLELLVRYTYFRNYLTKTGKGELLKQLEKKVKL
jgi:hypothetical protein